MRRYDWTVIRIKCGGTDILLALLVQWLHGGTEGSTCVTAIPFPKQILG